VTDLVSTNDGRPQKRLGRKLEATLNVIEKTISCHFATLIADRKNERRGSKKTGGYWVVKG
jgi:hypothetical protein